MVEQAVSGGAAASEPAVWSAPRGWAREAERVDRLWAESEEAASAYTADYLSSSRRWRRRWQAAVKAEQAAVEAEWALEGPDGQAREDMARHGGGPDQTYIAELMGVRSEWRAAGFAPGPEADSYYEAVQGCVEAWIDAADAQARERARKAAASRRRAKRRRKRNARRARRRRERKAKEAARLAQVAAQSTPARTARVEARRAFHLSDHSNAGTHD